MAEANNTLPEPYRLPAARGGSTGFDTQYKVGQHTYPADLLSDQQRYGGNYVIFYVNVHEDSYIVKGKDSVVFQGNIPPRQAGNLAGADYSAANLNTYAVGVGAGLSTAANPVGRALNVADRGASLQGAVKTVTNGVVGGVAAVSLVAALGGAKKEYKRLEQAIALNVPFDLQVRYSAQYEEDSLAGSSAILEATGNTFSGNPINAASAGLSYLAGLALKTPGVGGTLSKTSGTAANPKKEQLFQQVDFRTFTFTYQFFPRSAAEAQNVREIIKAFKLHMHPEYKPGSANFLFIYPSEFDIFYYQNGKENLNIHRHTSCVLTDMSVLYTPQGIFSAFDDGMPTQINMNLTFKELAILTKENIADGF